MKQESARLVVQVQPNASANRVVRFEEGVWYLKIAAAPIKGKANRELIKFLSDRLGVKKSSITIEKGHNSRRKVITVEGMGEVKLTIDKDSKAKQGNLFSINKGKQV